MIGLKKGDKMDENKEQAFSVSVIELMDNILQVGVTISELKRIKIQAEKVIKAWNEIKDVYTRISQGFTIFSDIMKELEEELKSDES